MKADNTKLIKLSLLAILVNLPIKSSKILKDLAVTSKLLNSDSVVILVVNLPKIMKES